MSASGILKTRPKIRVRIPNEIRAGQPFRAEVLLDAKRAVEVDFVHVVVVGTEWFTYGGGKTQRTVRRELCRLAARLCDERELPEGRTVLPVTIPLPEGAPASYVGSRAGIEYELAAHVSIPWWPDRRSAFEIHVAPAEVGSPETAPRIFSSDPNGPHGTEPHVELSLAHDWTRVGDAIRGAFALHNVAHHRYSEVSVSLVATQEGWDGNARRTNGESLRYRVRVGAEHAQEGEMIPFEFRIPEEASPSFHRRPRPGQRTGALALKHELELDVGIRWAKNLCISAPFTLLPRSARRGDAPARLAPPIIGTDRLRTIWEAVAAARGLDYGHQSMHGRFGETELVVRREHRGRAGIHLVAELRYPQLHLALDVEPASGLRAFVGGGVEIGDPGWDRAHYVVARDAQQVAVVLRRLVPHMEGTTLQRMDDVRLVLSRRDAGQQRGVLEAFAARAADIAARMEEARGDLPPPYALTQARAAWETLAGRLGGTLETARMRATGRLSMMEAEARVAFDGEGQPMETWLAIAPPTPIDSEHAARWRPGQEPPWTGEAKGVAEALGEDVLELHVEPTRISARAAGLLGMPGGLDADRAERTLTRLARLAQRLRGDAGPYR